MLKSILGGCNGLIDSTTHSQALRNRLSAASISTNTAINNSLRRSQREGIGGGRRPLRHSDSAVRTNNGSDSSHTARSIGRNRVYRDRSESPPAKRPPFQRRTLNNAADYSGTSVSTRSLGPTDSYSRTPVRPVSKFSRFRTPVYQQGQDGKDLEDAERKVERHRQLKHDRRVPRSVVRRAKRVDKRADLNGMAQKSNYDYTPKPGGSRALRRAARFGKNIESSGLPSTTTSLASQSRSNSQRIQRYSLRDQHSGTSSEPNRSSQQARRTNTTDYDDEEHGGLSIPEDLREYETYEEPQRRLFTMGRQAQRREPISFSGRAEESSHESPIPSDTGDFGRYGRTPYRDGDFGQSDTRSNVPISIPYTTPASEFLYGTSVVTAALLSSRRKLYKLYIYGGDNRESHSQDTRIRHLALDRNVVVERVKGDWLRLLDKMSLGRPHNGYILEASPLPKLPVTGLQRITKPQGPLYVILDHQSREDEEINGRNTNIKYDVAFPRYPLILLLDGILDPGNLGAILRTAFFLGVDAVAIANRSSAPLSSVALKASAGATENLPLMSVSQPGSFIDTCKSHGWKVYAATAPSPRQRSGTGNYFSTSGLVCPLRNHPCLLILGGEGEGLRWNLQQKADFEVGIDGQRIGKGGVDSLNVSVAAGLLCEAFLRKPVGLKNVLVDAARNEDVDGSDTDTEDRLF